MNKSSNSTDDGWGSLPIYLLYSIQGSVISGSNLIIALSIVRYEALRTSKEYLVMLGLSLADSCNLSGFLAAGVYRIKLLFDGEHGKTLSTWECANKLHNILLIIGVPWSNVMLALVSLDRLFCVSMPLKYLGWSRKYAYGILVPAFMCGLANCGAYLLSSYIISEEAKKVAAPCVTYAVLKEAPPSLSFVIQTVPSFFAFFSVFTYIGVWYKYKKQFTGVSPITGSARYSLQAEQLRRQRRVTVSLALSCLCTFVLFCVPMITANVLFSNGENRVALFFYLLSTVNPLCNVFIYQIRHREMRMALGGLLFCKNLPIDIRMWIVNKNTQHDPSIGTDVSTNSETYSVYWLTVVVVVVVCYLLVISEHIWYFFQIL